VSDDTSKAPNSGPLTPATPATGDADPRHNEPNVDPAAAVATTTQTADVVGVRQGMFGARGSGDTSGYGGLTRSISMPAPAERPYGGWYDELADGLARALGDVAAGDVDGEVSEGGAPSYDDAIEKAVVDRGELTLFVRRAHLLAVARQLRDQPDLRFEMCLGVSGVHFPQETGRELHAVYPLLSITHGGKRIRLEVVAPEGDPHIPSIVSVYPGNDWHERETWDMFGIVFDGHPALTRILMPDDWPGHPQRKDYPLGGIPVEYKGAEIPPPDQRRTYS
jgi:NADH-quinone oxidoreductase subunit C